MPRNIVWIGGLLVLLVAHAALASIIECECGWNFHGKPNKNEGPFKFWCQIDQSCSKLKTDNANKWCERDCKCGLGGKLEGYGLGHELGRSTRFGGAITVDGVPLLSQFTGGCKDEPKPPEFNCGCKAYREYVRSLRK